MSKIISRCAWVTEDPIYINYHDHEWGVPVYDDRALFELLILEGAQAGLSWLTILKRREGYRQSFDQFDATKMVHYDAKKIASLLNNPGIIRNRLKVLSAIDNAKAFLAIQASHSSFSNYIWSFVDGQPICNHWKTQNAVPVSTTLSDQLSKSLKKMGFKFVGSTICYAFMQATGMVNDHICDCFCYSKNKINL